MGKGTKTASGEVVTLKTSYEVQEKLEAFYTGGQVQLSSNGNHMFTCCGSSLKVLHVDTGKVEQSFEEEEDLVTCFALSPDNKILVAAWRSQQLKQYDWEEGKCVRSWRPLQGAVVAMAIDSTSTLLATGSSSGIKVWDCVQQYCTHNLRGSGGLVCLLTFHPDPSHPILFSSSTTDTSIKVWDLQTSKCVANLRGHVSPITSLGFFESAKVMISAGRDKVLHIWSLTDNTLTKTLPVFEAVEGLVVLQDEGLTFGGEGERKKRGQGGKRKDKEETGMLVATAGDKGVVRIWDLAKGRLAHSLEPLPQPSVGGGEREGEEEEEEEREHTPQVYTGLLHCKVRRALVGITYDHNIIFYDLETLQKKKQLIGYCDEILDMRFLGSEGSQLAVATNSEHIKIFHRGSQDCQVLCGHSRVVLSLDASSKGSLLATSSKDHTIRVWGEVSSESGRSEFMCQGIGSGHTQAVGAVALTRLSGAFAVSGSQDCTIKLWSLQGLAKWKKGDSPIQLPVKYTQLAHDKDINAVDISPNDKLIATGSQDKTAKLWLVSNGSLVGTLRGHRRGVWSVQFSPVDQCVLTASGDMTMKLWAVSDCSCIKTFEGHTMSVLKAIFLTRGMQIASSGSDGLVKIWTVKTNECVSTLDLHTEKVWSLTSSQDGSWLASGGADSLICLWKDVTKEVEAEKQEAKENRILQEQELSNYLHQKDYVRAVGLAISLDQPLRVHSILSELLEEEGEEGTFSDTLTALRDDQIHSILKYLTKWNMNAKHSRVAQTVLSHILRSYTPEALMAFDGLHSILEGLIPYTERHFQRLSRLLQLSMFVDYTWQCMKLPDLPQSSTGQQLPRVEGGETHRLLPREVVAAVADTTTLGGEPLFVEDPNPDHTLHSYPDHAHLQQSMGSKEQDGHVTSTSGGDEGDGEGGGKEEGKGEEEEEEEDGVWEDVEEEEESREGRDEDQEKVPKPKASRRQLLRRVRRAPTRRGLRYLATRRKRTPYKS